MAGIAIPKAPDILQRIVRLQVCTIAWMTLEVIVALAAAWAARSPALLGSEATVLSNPLGDYRFLAVSLRTGFRQGGEVCSARRRRVALHRRRVRHRRLWTVSSRTS